MLCWGRLEVNLFLQRSLWAYWSLEVPAQTSSSEGREARASSIPESLSLSQPQSLLRMTSWPRCSFQCPSDCHPSQGIQDHCVAAVEWQSGSHSMLFPTSSGKCIFGLWRCRLRCSEDSATRPSRVYAGLLDSHWSFCKRSRARWTSSCDSRGTSLRGHSGLWSPLQAGHCRDWILLGRREHRSLSCSYWGSLWTSWWLRCTSVQQGRLFQIQNSPHSQEADPLARSVKSFHFACWHCQRKPSGSFCRCSERYFFQFNLMRHWH